MESLHKWLKTAVLAFATIYLAGALLEPFVTRARSDVNEPAFKPGMDFWEARRISVRGKPVDCVAVAYVFPNAYQLAVSCDWESRHHAKDFRSEGQQP